MLNKPVLSFLAIAGLCLLSVATGCADKGYQKADLAAEALTTAKAEASAAQIQMNKTVDSLSNLVNKPAPDLKPQYKAYSDNVNLLEEQAASLHSKANTMEEKKTAWLTQWETNRAQIKDPSIRAASQARADEAKAQFGKVGDAYRNLQKSFGTVRQNLQDVNTVLSNDLSQGGVKSLGPVLTTIQTNQATANADFEALRAEFGRVSSEYSSKQIPPPGSTATTAPAPAQ
jgi:chromosome segregation ATPase